jgi:predicted nucleotidyltransferase
MLETEDRFRHFTSSERSCLERFLDTLRSVFGSDLREVWLFGSFARGDTWGGSIT